jgi:2-phospho-L-lactate guanylyltransferase
VTAPAAVVVPLRAFAAGKSRLTSLSPAEHERLVRWMAERVVDAAHPLPVAVVSSDAAVREWADHRGLTVLEDPGTLDGAARAGVVWARDLGARRAVIAHADLPRARSLLPLAVDGGRPVVAAVPCRHDDGTPVLSVPLADSPAFEFAYGPGSFRRHGTEARRLGLGFRVVRDATLAHDIDTDDDLAVFDAVR